MITTQPQTRILLASRALHQQSSTFHIASQRPLFSYISEIEEVTLGAEECYPNGKNKPCFILPLVGAVQVNSQILEAGESLFTSEEEVATLSNPFEDQAIHFLKIGFSEMGSFSDVLDKDVFGNKQNQLHKILNEEELKISLGRFDGRFDTESQLHGTSSKVLAYVLEGAFELQNCLLEKGDALEITSSENVEFEALSNNAILLLIEYSGEVS